MIEDRDIISLRRALCRGWPLHTAAAQLRLNPQECDVALWMALGRKLDVPPPSAARVTHRQISSSPSRQAMGREREPAPPQDDKHLAALKFSFPVLGA